MALDIHMYVPQNSIDLVVSVNPDVENQAVYEGKPSSTGHDFAKSSHRAQIWYAMYMSSFGQLYMIYAR